MSKINRIKEYISKHTANRRYNLMFKMMKCLTPSFNKKISYTDKVSKLPRPTTMMLKEKYGNTPLIGVEIGVQRGENSQSILDELNIEKLYLIDVWDLMFFGKTQEGISLTHRDHINLMKVYGFPFIGKRKKQRKKQPNIDNYGCVLSKFKGNKKIELIRDFSNIAVEYFHDDTLDFVYIDANHSYDKVLEDISIWTKKVKPYGIVSGHDTHLTDVLQAVIDYSIKHKQQLIIEHPDWYFIKT